MHDGTALAFGNLTLDLFADLAGPLGTRTGRTFFVVKLGLRPSLTSLAFVFSRGFLLFARVQPIGESGSHSDNELEMVENPVHRRKRRRESGRKLRKTCIGWPRASRLLRLAGV